VYWVIERVYFPEETLGNVTAVKGKDVLQRKTLELPDLNNSTDISCIPEGLYWVEKVKSSEAFDYPHFHIVNVPHRTGIKVHILNFKNETRGCVGVGKNFKDLNADDLTDITNSKDTLKELWNFSDDRFLLWIKS